MVRYRSCLTATTDTETILIGWMTSFTGTTTSDSTKALTKHYLQTPEDAFWSRLPIEVRVGLAAKLFDEVLENE